MEGKLPKDWKRFYREERQRYPERIDMEIDRWSGEAKILPDPGGSCLSFPHTSIEWSLIPVTRTALWALEAEVPRVAAIGVMHRVSGGDPENEFSLDSFRHILGRAADRLDIDMPEVKEEFLPRHREVLFDLDLAVSTFREEGARIGEGLEPGTPIVMTGDLRHYGYGYGTTPPVREDSEDLMRDVRIGLDMVYKEKDPRGYLEHSIEVLNDQAAAAIAVSELLGDPLDYSVLSAEMSDYSGILNERKPTLVASVFYEVHKV